MDYEAVGWINVVTPNRTVAKSRRGPTKDKTTPDPFFCPKSRVPFFRRAYWRFAGRSTGGGGSGVCRLSRRFFRATDNTGNQYGREVEFQHDRWPVDCRRLHLAVSDYRIARSAALAERCHRNQEHHQHGDDERRHYSAEVQPALCVRLGENVAQCRA